MRVKQELNKELNKMTCKDCIHFTTEHPELTEYRKCEKQTTDEYQAYVVADKKVCKDFEKNDL